jgi:hypothetical protein
MNRSFVWGVIIGVGGTWAFHKFVKPIGAGKGAS